MTGPAQNFAPGWYESPHEAGSLQYWNGVKWTPEFQDPDGKARSAVRPASWPAVVSLIIGCVVPFMLIVRVFDAAPVVMGAIGVVLGIVGVVNGRRPGGRLTGLAIVGLVVSFCGVLLYIVGVGR